MKNSKLIELLKALSKEELLEFQEFVASPYFNKNDDLVKLVNYLSEAGPDYPIDKIKKEYVFGLLFPNIPFDKKRMSYLMNYLLKLGERFLAIRQIEKKDSLLQTYTLRDFVDKKLYKHFKFLDKKLEKEMKNTDGKGEDYYWMKHEISKIRAEFIYSQKIRKGDNSIEALSESLDEFYFLLKLKYACEMLNRQAILKKKYDLSFAEKVKDYLKTKDNIPPIIKCYLEIYSLLSSEDDLHFQNILKTLAKSEDQIHLEELRDVYLFVINFGVRKIRGDRSYYLEQTLNLYKRGIEKKILFDKGFLSPWTYNNTVKLAFMGEEYDWIEKFIYAQKDSLAQRFKEDAFNYSMAELYYHKREFEKVKDQLMKVHFSEMHYQLGSRAILLKTYYAEEEIEALLSLLASFLQFLRRSDEISIQLKKPYINFCNFLNKILRQDERKRDLIREEIKNTPLLAEKNWLLKVLAENKII